MQGDELTVTLAVVIGVIVLAALAWFLIRRRHSNALRAKFGDEYDRTVSQHGPRAGEANLEARAKRVADLDIRPLGPQEREQFSGEWHEVKALFVDSPKEAVLRADRLLTEMMRTRGFPMGDFDRRYEDLTVSHAQVAADYRAGHQIAHMEGATTEDLRQALQHYEALFTEMVRPASDADEHRRGVRSAAGQPTH